MRLSGGFYEMKFLYMMMYFFGGCHAQSNFSQSDGRMETKCFKT